MGLLTDKIEREIGIGIANEEAICDKCESKHLLPAVVAVRDLCYSLKLLFKIVGFKLSCFFLGLLYTHHVRKEAKRERFWDFGIFGIAQTLLASAAVCVCVRARASLTDSQFTRKK